MNELVPNGVFKPLKNWRKPKNKWKAQLLNDATFYDYLFRLKELCINMFEWKGLPDTIDVDMLENWLCEYGYVLYFNDEAVGNLALTCMYGGPLNVYRKPIYRRAYAANYYQKDLTIDNSVLIYNNYLHTPSMDTLVLYARRLFEIERAIDVNVKAQKTPVMILCDDSQLLTMKNVYEKYDGNEPVIFGSKNLDIKGIQVLKTEAPFVSAELQLLKQQVWNEALEFCGVTSTSTKRERLVEDEANQSMGGVLAQRNVMLNSRQQAAKRINEMFGTNISVDFKQQISDLSVENDLDMDLTETEISDNIDDREEE